MSYSHIIHVLDDFLFIGPPESEICKQGLKVVRLICESVRISLKEEKSKMAVMQKIFLGIEILDTLAIEMRLPYTTKMIYLLYTLHKYQCIKK